MVMSNNLEKKISKEKNLEIEQSRKEKISKGKNLEKQNLEKKKSRMKKSRILRCDSYHMRD